MTATDPIQRKYADKVSPEMEKMFGSIDLAVRLMVPFVKAMRELDKAERDAHSILHITNPTIYRDMAASPNFKRNVEMVREALRFIDKVRAIAPDWYSDLEALLDSNFGKDADDNEDQVTV